MSIIDSVGLRLATPDDEDFLRRLFANTRMDEFKFLHGDAAQLNALVEMQFDLQRRQYADAYPAAEHNIILRDGQAIGRLLVDEGDRDVILVDVVLMSEHRNSGIGTHLLNELLSRATRAKKSVRLHVVKSNPARRLYERLGFSKVGEDGMYFEMLAAPGRAEQHD